MGKSRKTPEWLGTIEHPKKRAFLQVFAERGNANEACRATGIARSTEFFWRTEDAEYRRVWEVARAIGAEAVEQEALRRAFGNQKPVLDEDGNEIARTCDGSDTLLIFLLKGLYPDKYRENWKGEISGPGGGPIRTAVDLSKLSEEELATLERIAARAAEPGDSRG